MEKMVVLVRCGHSAEGGTGLGLLSEPLVPLEGERVPASWVQTAEKERGVSTFDSKVIWGLERKEKGHQHQEPTDSVLAWFCNFFFMEVLQESPLYFHKTSNWLSHFVL